jgi:L-aminopeptidase/D-esterase-like protein
MPAITDVSGVRVGQATVSEGTALRTGVTAVVFDPITGTRPAWPSGV